MVKYLRFLDWASLELQREGDKARLRTEYWRVIDKFIESSRYKNDARYLGLWIAFAEFDPAQSLSVYQAMDAQRVGHELGAFYQKYAEALEKAGDSEGARKAYERGLSFKTSKQSAVKDAASLRLKYEAFLQRTRTASGGSRDCAAGYDAQLLVDENDEETCFEEQRLRQRQMDMSGDMSMTLAAGFDASATMEESAYPDSPEPAPRFSFRSQPSLPFAIFQSCPDQENIRIARDPGGIKVSRDPIPAPLSDENCPVPAASGGRRAFGVIATATATTTSATAAAKESSSSVRGLGLFEAAVEEDPLEGCHTIRLVTVGGMAEQPRLSQTETTMSPGIFRQLADSACKHTITFTAPESNEQTAAIPQAVTFTSPDEEEDFFVDNDESIADGSLDNITGALHLVDDSVLAEVNPESDDSMTLADSRRSSSLHSIPSSNRRMSRRISSITPGMILLLSSSSASSSSSSGAAPQEEADDEEDYWSEADLIEAVTRCAASESFKPEIEAAAANCMDDPTLFVLHRKPAPLPLARIPGSGHEVFGMNVPLELHFIQLDSEIQVQARNSSSRAVIRSFTIKATSLDASDASEVSDTCQFPQNSETQILRVSSPPDLWEWYIVSKIQERLQSQELAGLFPRTAGMYIYDNHGYFLTSFASEMSLADALDAGGDPDSGYPEDLALFRAVELLRLVEAAHRANVVHGGLSPSALMLPMPQGLLTSKLPTWSGELCGGWQEVSMVISNFANATDACIVSEEDADFSLDHRGVFNVLTRLIDRPEIKTAWVRPLWKELLSSLRTSSGHMNGPQSVRFLSELRSSLTKKILPHASRVSSAISIELHKLSLLKTERFIADNPTITITSSFLG